MGPLPLGKNSHIFSSGMQEWLRAFKSRLIDPPSCKTCISTSEIFWLAKNKPLSPLSLLFRPLPVPFQNLTDKLARVLLFSVFL